MAKGTLLFPFGSFVGRLGRHSQLYGAIRYGLQYFGFIGKRNFRKYPVTPREIETHNNMRQASLAYNRIDRSSEDFLQLQRDFCRQRNYGVKYNKPYKKTLRGYFISRYIADLESHRTLK